MAQTQAKKICMLASGGDAPGMNACMEAIFNYASQLGLEVWVSVLGYDGLLTGNVVRATREKCNNISHIAGCVYKAGRSLEFNTPEGTVKAGDFLKRNNFETLIVIGGNGSLQGMERLKRMTGVNVIGIPATVDNDCFFMNNSLGFSSSSEAIVRYIDQIKPTMQTNERNFMLQVMGKGCSELALTAGIASFANVVDRSQNRLTAKQIADQFNSQRAKGNKTCMAIFEEHRTDLNTFLQDVQVAANDKNIRAEMGYYYMRGATPSCRDRFLAAHYGVMAVDLVQAKKFGVAIGMLNDEFKTFELEAANKAQPKFNETNFNLLNKISNW